MGEPTPVLATHLPQCRWHSGILLWDEHQEVAQERGPHGMCTMGVGGEDRHLQDAPAGPRMHQATRPDPVAGPAEDDAACQAAGRAACQAPLRSMPAILLIRRQLWNSQPEGPIMTSTCMLHVHTWSPSEAPVLTGEGRPAGWVPRSRGQLPIHIPRIPVPSCGGFRGVGKRITVR